MPRVAVADARPSRPRIKRGNSAICKDMNDLTWEHFHHEADIGVRGVGQTLAEAFNAAALAMIAVITDPDTVEPRQAISIRCHAPDQELLLTDWLNALVFEMATKRMLFRRFDVTIDGETLRGTAWGEPIDPLRHRPAVEVKGATFTELAVQKLSDGRWLAQCVVDV